MGGSSAVDPDLDTAYCLELATELARSICEIPDDGDTARDNMGSVNERVMLVKFSIS